MICNHSHYRVLCGLAAASQLSESELFDLEAHTNLCIECKDRLNQMREMSYQLFLANAAAVRKIQPPSGMAERFVGRAIRSGISLSRKPEPLRVSNVLKFGMMTCVALVSVSLSWKLHSVDHLRTALTVAEVAPINSLSIVHRGKGPPLIETRKPENVQTALSPTTVRQVGARPERRKLASALEPHNRVRQPPANTAQMPTFSRDPYLFHGGISAAASMADYVTSGLDHSSAVALVNVSTSALWNSVEREHVEAHVFHYSPKLASLSFLDVPKIPRSPTRFSNLNTETPTFRLDLTRVR